MPNRTRRTFLHAAVGLAISGAPGPALAARQTPVATPPTVPPEPATPVAGSVIRILAARHPFGPVNEWLNGAIASWASQFGASAGMTGIPQADMANAMRMETRAAAGHDLVLAFAPLIDHAIALTDLTDVQQAAVRDCGPQLAHCTAATTLDSGATPSFCFGWIPSPTVFRQSLWDPVGFHDGPATWQDMIDAGSIMWNQQGLSIGIGFSEEASSERTAMTALRAFGARLQDENGHLALDRPETRAAIGHMRDLFVRTMTLESMHWSPDRNYLLLRDGAASLISGEVSTLRRMRAESSERAMDIRYRMPPLREDGSATLAPPTYLCAHVPTWSAQAAAAKELALELARRSNEMVNGTQLAVFPAFPDTIPGFFDSGHQLDADPFGSQPPDVFGSLKPAASWSAGAQHPGPATMWASAATASYLLSRMMARALGGEQTADESIAQAVKEANDLRRSFA